MFRGLPNSDTERNSDRYRNANSDSYGYRDSYRNGNCNGDCDTNAHAYSKSVSGSTGP